MPPFFKIQILLKKKNNQKSLWQKQFTKIKDRANIAHRDEYLETRFHWIALYNFLKNVLYFDSFGVQHISKDVKNRSIKTVFQDIYKNKKKKRKYVK